MKRILLLSFCLFTFALGFSQNEKLIHGKVSFRESYPKNVDVINFTTQTITHTNTLGEFTTEAKVGDALIFMSEDFADQKYILSPADFEKRMLIITLIEKPIPLEEVEITQIKAIKIAATSYNGIRMAQIQKAASNPKNKDVYTGEIENGMDFIQIGKMIGSLFKSKNPKSNKAEEKITFTDYAKANFNESFYSKTLKLNPNETSRFLDYCEADPKSKTVIKSNDELSVLEFLLAKKVAFDKLK